MICILQVVCLVCGIMAIAKGKISLSKNRVIVGTPARVIGGIMAAWLPLALGAGLVLGVYLAMSNPNRPPEDFVTAMAKYWWVDVVVALLVFVAVVVVASMASKVSPEELAAQSSTTDMPAFKPDSGNPYDPPQSN